MADLSPSLWKTATISDIRIESPRTKTFRLELDEPYPFVAGQRCSVQLTAPDGYTAARDYSFSSAPSSGQVELTIAHAPHGEVSGWFNLSAEIGDRIGLSRANGGHFIWQPKQAEPVLLIAGGVGVTPLMSMLREHRAHGSLAPMSLFYSARNYDEICFKDELMYPQEAENIEFTLVESIPGDWQGHSGLVTADMILPLLLPDMLVYVCGPTAYVEAVDNILIHDLDIDPDRVKTERFG